LRISFFGCLRLEVSTSQFAVLSMLLVKITITITHECMIK
jgi:hypothetical protein